MRMNAFGNVRTWTRACVCAAVATTASSALADFTITNGNFEASTAQSTDIVDWFNFVGADPGAWWASAWQGPVVSFNGSTIFGLSGDPNIAAWAYQSAGFNDAGRTSVDLRFDVGMFADAGETRDLGVTVQLYQSDGSFVPAENSDISTATGVTLIDTKSTTTGALTASQFQRKTLNLNLAAANSTGEFFVRFSNFNGGAGAGDPWTMIDNIKWLVSPPHVPVQLTWVGAAEGGTWDMGASTAFKNAANVATAFQEGDHATFNNTAAVDGNGVSVVNIVGAIDAGHVVIDNAANHDFVFQGTGGVTAIEDKTLIKRGAGKVTFSNNAGNTFLGGVTIEAGTVELTGTTNGSSNGIGGPSVVNNGTIISNRQYTDPAAINEWNPLTLAQEISGTGNLIIRNHTFLGQSAQGPRNNTFTGTVTLEGGFTYLADVNGLGSTTAGTTVLSGATLAVVDNWHLGDNAVIAEPITLNGPGVVSWFGGGNPAGALFQWEGVRTFSGAIHLASTSSINTRGTSVMTLSGPLTAAADAGLEKFGDGTLVINGATLESATIWGGTLRQAAGTSKVKSLTIEVGTLDLTTASFAVDYTGDSSYGDLLSKIESGGITTSAGANYVVGIIENALLATPMTSFGSPAVTVDSTSVLFRGTLKGDINLSGGVDFNDLLILAQNYDPAATGKLYQQGDTDYDGSVNFNDLLSLAQNYGLSALTDAQQSTLGEQFMEDYRLAVSLVPEPASLSVLALGAVPCRRRRTA